MEPPGGVDLQVRPEHEGSTINNESEHNVMGHGLMRMDHMITKAKVGWRSRLSPPMIALYIEPPTQNHRLSSSG